MTQRRIIIFDKREDKIIYDKPISDFGSEVTNLTNITLVDCSEEKSAYERKELLGLNKPNRIS